MNANPYRTYFDASGRRRMSDEGLSIIRRMASSFASEPETTRVVERFERQVCDLEDKIEAGEIDSTPEGFSRQRIKELLGNCDFTTVCK